MTKKLTLQVGVRVFHRRSKRGGLITGAPEHGVHSQLIPVAVEGTTRKELWPLHMVALRSKDDQLPRHGGSFTPPTGYPLNAA